jgi:hypothetical protein
MSLYRYVAAKDELVTLMVDAALGPPPDSLEQDVGWRAGLARWAWAALAIQRRHTWATRIPISGPPATPNQIAWMDRGLRPLRDTGLTASEKASVLLLLSGYVRNTVILESGLAEAQQAAGSTLQEAMAAYGRLLARVVDPGRFPALREVVAAGVLSKADDPDDEFIFGLERILDGIDALISTRAHT